MKNQILGLLRYDELEPVHVIVPKLMVCFTAIHRNYLVISYFSADYLASDSFSFGRQSLGRSYVPMSH